MILSLHDGGTTEIDTIAAISGAKPSYVGSVLQKEGLIDNYFDLHNQPHIRKIFIQNIFAESPVSKTTRQRVQALKLRNARIVIPAKTKTAPDNIKRSNRR